MICNACREQRHQDCPNPLMVKKDKSLTRSGSWCDCQHRLINMDALQESLEQMARGEGIVLRRREPSPPDS